MFVLKTALGLLFGASQALAANSGWVNNCPPNELDVVGTIDPNESICVGGQFTTKLNFFDILPCGDVYLTTNQTWFTAARGKARSKPWCLPMTGSRFRYLKTPWRRNSRTAPIA